MLAQHAFRVTRHPLETGDRSAGDPGPDLRINRSPMPVVVSTAGYVVRRSRSRFSNHNLLPASTVPYA